MKRVSIVLFSVLALVIYGGCGEDPTFAPQQPTVPTADDSQFESIALNLATLGGWEIDTPLGDALPAAAADCVTLINREPIVDDIVHYSFQIQVGDGPFDVIGLHRVVREQRPNRPIRTKKTVMLLHGDGAPFVTAFLTSTLSDAVADEHAIAVYLAAGNVDVWGIDLGWTLIPDETTDISFMADWGLQRDIDDLGTALGVARSTRAVTGSGYGKTHLLGWSRGVWIGFAYLNEESQKPYGLQHVRGFIPVDGWYKTDVEELRAGECAGVADMQALYDSGVYADDTGLFLKGMVDLAQTDPDGPSPIFPGATNLQAFLIVGTQTYFLAPIVPHYHLVAGVFNEFGLPTELQYMPTDLFLDFGNNWAAYEPLLMEIETQMVSCDEYDVPWDDYLTDITVPILYVGAGGGFGENGIYSTTLVGSTDVSSVVVELNPDEFLDFGHVDIFNADNAAGYVWQPVLEWIVEHSHPGKPDRVVHAGP